MTIYEHAMLGVTGTLAVGLHRRYGWQIVAVGGLAAVLPDWDGLAFVGGAAWFDRLHRTAGHNLVACVGIGVIVALVEYRVDLFSRARRALGRWLRSTSSERSIPPPRHVFRAGELGMWMAVAAAASLSHLAADVVYSGHEVYTDWGLKLLWPFSDRTWAYPIIHWGDVVTTVIFAAGMFAMVRWPTRLQTIALATLGGVLAYVVARAMLTG